MKVLVFASAIFLCACASSDLPSGLWDRPEAYDGQEFFVTAYPYDLLGDPERYVLCTEPCTADDAQRMQVVVFPVRAGAFDGMNGRQPVQLHLRFDGRCFNDSGSLCLLTHRPFEFVEIE